MENDGEEYESYIIVLSKRVFSSAILLIAYIINVYHVLLIYMNLYSFVLINKGASTTIYFCVQVCMLI